MRPALINKTFHHGICGQTGKPQRNSRRGKVMFSQRNNVNAVRIQKYSGFWNSRGRSTDGRVGAADCVLNCTGHCSVYVCMQIKYLVSTRTIAITRQNIITNKNCTVFYSANVMWGFSIIFESDSLLRIQICSSYSVLLCIIFILPIIFYYFSTYLRE